MKTLSLIALLSLAGAAVEYERLLGNSISLGVRAVTLDYEWEDGSYLEEGDARGLDLVARYYFERSGFKGFYLGGGIGYYWSDWDWRDPNNNPTRGSGDSKLWNLSGVAGYKHFFDRSVYADVFALLGRFEGKSTNESTGTRKTQLSGYFALGAGLGVTF